MADLILATYSIEKFNTKNNRDHDLEQDSNKNTPCVASYSRNELIFQYAVNFVIGLLAAYLSWECNTAAGLSVAEKVLWALLAYMFSLPFLIYYVLIRSHECIPLLEKYRKKNKK